MGKNLCGSCKRCCKNTLIRVSKKDIDRWKKQQRYDILLCLVNWPGGTVALLHKNEKSLDECIFLTDNGCEIYDTRPEMCKLFPRSAAQVSLFNCQLELITHIRK